MNNSLKQIITLLGISLISIPITNSNSYGASCAGVEFRVNSKTNDVKQAILNVIKDRQNTLVQQENLEREKLLNAIRVFTRQDSVGSDQMVNGEQASQLALSNVIVEQSVNDQIHQTMNEYGSAGYNACGLVAQARTIAQQHQNYMRTRQQLANNIQNRRSPNDINEFNQQLADWNKLIKNSSGATISSLLNGDQRNAEIFMAIVAGPPRSPTIGGKKSAVGSFERVITLKNEARTSAAVFVLSDIAAGAELRKEMAKISDQWLGNDGGRNWAATAATQSERQALLDAVRIEANNIAMNAFELKQQLTQEFALSVFATTYIDNLSNNNGGEAQ